MEPKMFCFQCQETAGNKGCMFGGVCGKKPETANLQDLLIYVTKGLSEITTRLRSEGKEIPAAIDRLITTNLFMTSLTLILTMTVLSTESMKLYPAVTNCLNSSMTIQD